MPFPSKPLKGYALRGAAGTKQGTNLRRPKVASKKIVTQHSKPENRATGPFGVDNAGHSYGGHKKCGSVYGGAKFETGTSVKCGEKKGHTGKHFNSFAMRSW